MDFRINWDGSGVFAVPDSAVDNGLKLASGKAVKVLLYLLRYKSDENICTFLGISEEDAEDAVAYWKQVGVILPDGHQPVSVQAVQPAPAVQKIHAKPAAAAVPPKAAALRPAEIAARISESNEVKNLFELIQVSLGRTLTYDDQNTLIWIYDHLGMCMEVILMLVNYCVSIGKGNMHYIEKMAVGWSEEGIDSGKKADEKILMLQKKNSLAEKCRSSMQIDRRLSKKELDYIGVWAAGGADIDIVMNAYDRTVNNTGKLSFPYMNSILTEWLSNGVTTSEEADAYSEKNSPARETAASRKSAPKPKETSFDLDLIMEHAKNTPLRVRPGGQDQ